MRIVNVTPGLIPIPPNGWGAVEKIIWETHKNLLNLNHESRILYRSEVKHGEHDVVHVHIANLALELQEVGIPYYFTFHDHHAYLYGKDSPVYKENLQAMRGSIKSFVPAKYLVDYFEGIPEYFSHGVDTLYFSGPDTRSIHKLLCVANNGYAYDQSIDRKGFGIAIEAAQRLGLPITIAGPSNNKNYFEKNPPTYDKLTILYDLSEEELLTVYRNHSIFLHPSQLEAGHPNLTLVEALSCGLPVVGTFEQNNSLDGMEIVEAEVGAVVQGIQRVIENYTAYTTSARKHAELLDWYNRTKELVSIYTTNELPSMKKQLINHYKNTPILKKSQVRKFNFNCINGMFAEILGGQDIKYSVKFIDKKTDTVVYNTELTRNSWAKPNIKYYVDWRVEITEKNTGQSMAYNLELKGNRVYIALDSKSLGDTFAWIPYVDEFRKKHNCEVICSTFWNDLFISEYPEITFVTPGETAHNLMAMYVIGLFHTGNTFDSDKHPTNPISVSLQQIASDILGLEYKEIKPKVKQPDIDNTDSKLVTIATHSTAQSKYWNNPFGWQEVVNWLKERGYTVKLLSQEEDGYMGNRNPAGVEQFPRSPIDKVIEELKRSKAFIGISSGLSWVSWAVGTPTVMISGFTEPFNEMQDCIRISAPKGKCSGCWNRHKFDPGDWNWCPDHKGTLRQFECSREITADMVIKELEKIL
jgi:autotransporter strand-loop-strand O-heptosyltransferase